MLSSAARAAAHHRHHLRWGACSEALCNVLSTAEGVTRSVGILMRTDGFSPSNVSLAAGPGTPNPARTLVDVARSTSADDIELSSSALLFLDDSFQGLDATKNAPLLKIKSSSFPAVFGGPTTILREVHIATRVHHGPQRPDWSSHVQHTMHCCDSSNFRVVAHLSHSALLHFCSWQRSRFTRFAKAVPLAVFE